MIMVHCSYSYICILFVVTSVMRSLISIWSNAVYKDIYVKHGRSFAKRYGAIQSLHCRHVSVITSLTTHHYDDLKWSWFLGSITRTSKLFFFLDSRVPADEIYYLKYITFTENTIDRSQELTIRIYKTHAIVEVFFNLIARSLIKLHIDLIRS